MCLHDLAEKETAVGWDGLCPICLDAKVKVFRAALDDIARYEPGNVYLGDYAVAMKQRARDALSEANK
jgi:hypothetical protein